MGGNHEFGAGCCVISSKSLFHFAGWSAISQWKDSQSSATICVCHPGFGWDADAGRVDLVWQKKPESLWTMVLACLDKTWWRMITVVNCKFLHMITVWSLWHDCCPKQFASLTLILWHSIDSSSSTSKPIAPTYEVIPLVSSGGVHILDVERLWLFMGKMGKLRLEFNFWQTCFPVTRARWEMRWQCRLFCDDSVTSECC